MTTRMELNRIYNEDCMAGMEMLPDKSVDMILCDLPYNTTGLKWDKALPMDLLWLEYKRLIKDGGAIVLFATQPFTTRLIASNMGMWRYNWTWLKTTATGFLNSGYRPLKITEDICIFSNGATSPTGKIHCRYNPQMTVGKPYHKSLGKLRKQCACIRSGLRSIHRDNEEGTRYPVNILRFPLDNPKLHPTQKPVALLEYLIRTYTSEDEIILDNCMGSGSTAIACMNTGRNFIGYEKDPEFYGMAIDRIKRHETELKGELFTTPIF